jgi:hypothetical protein
MVSHPLQSVAMDDTPNYSESDSVRDYSLHVRSGLNFECIGNMRVISKGTHPIERV